MAPYGKKYSAHCLMHLNGPDDQYLICLDGGGGLGARESHEVFVAAVKQRLMGAYERKAFRRMMMIVDGCFVLEALRTATATAAGVTTPYTYSEPSIFCAHGMPYTLPLHQAQRAHAREPAPLPRPP